MVDPCFVDAGLAALYDQLNPCGPGDEFYLGQVMSAGTVLDVGCGTGALLRRGRKSGHPGRLCGLDPADAMLMQARICSDVEWLLGDLPTAGLQHEFELVTMTGHTFQFLGQR